VATATLPLRVFGAPESKRELQGFEQTFIFAGIADNFR
jgi:hypothetical protein